MVRQCLTIYDNCEDAWERVRNKNKKRKQIKRKKKIINTILYFFLKAQTEELNVFKKCSTPVIYKSSALLSINKLRKEALGNIS